MKSENTKVTEEGSTTTVPKSQMHIILEIVEYVPDSIVCKTIIKNRNGKLSVVAFDKGEQFCETLSKSDIYVQIIEGKAAVIIKNKNHHLKLGQSIIIPVNTLHCFKADSKFKMISTIIKES